MEHSSTVTAEGGGMREAIEKGITQKSANGGALSSVRTGERAEKFERVQRRVSQMSTSSLIGKVNSLAT